MHKFALLRIQNGGSSEINNKDIRVGDTAVIERAGDVIPQVISVDVTKRNNKSKKYIFPVKCLCGADTKKEFSKFQTPESRLPGIPIRGN